MAQEYWSGVATGAGLGLSIGLIGTIWIVLWLVGRRPLPPRPADVSSVTDAARRYGT